MTLTMERAKKARSLKTRRRAKDITTPFPMNDSVKRIVAEAAAHPKRELSPDDAIEFLLWLKADLADAAIKGGLRDARSSSRPY